jgi:hypothetical protein
MRIFAKNILFTIMEVTLRIKQDCGTMIEVVRELPQVFDDNLLTRVEQEISAIKHQLLPILSVNLIEHHQVEFKGEKNKEKERA